MEVECECNLNGLFFTEVENLIAQYGSSESSINISLHWDLISFQVVFVSTASLILFILVFFLIGIPARLPQHGSSTTGLSVLETLWIAAHFQTLCEHMADVNDPSMNELRRVSMLKVCLGNIRDSQSNEAESETFLKWRTVSISCLVRSLIFMHVQLTQTSNLYWNLHPDIPPFCHDSYYVFVFLSSCHRIEVVYILVPIRESNLCWTAAIQRDPACAPPY